MIVCDCAVHGRMTQDEDGWWHCYPCEQDGSIPFPLEGNGRTSRYPM